MQVIVLGSSTEPSGKTPLDRRLARNRSLVQELEQESACCSRTNPVFLTDNFRHSSPLRPVRRASPQDGHLTPACARSLPFLLPALAPSTSARPFVKVFGHRCPAVSEFLDGLDDGRRLVLYNSGSNPVTEMERSGTSVATPGAEFLRGSHPLFGSMGPGDGVTGGVLRLCAAGDEGRSYGGLRCE